MQEEEIENKTRIAQALDDLTIDNKEQDNEINSMKTALSQAIISKDEQMIWKMLQTNDLRLINNTLANFPKELIKSLVEFLVRWIQNSPSDTGVMLLWLRILLKVNFSQIVNMPEVLEMVKGSIGVLKRKENVLTRIRKVKGKLDLVLAIRDKKQQMKQEITDFSNMKPLVVFKEEGEDGPEYQDVGGYEDEEEEGLDDSIDDEFEEEVDQRMREGMLDDMLAQEAYENEGIMEDENVAESEDEGSSEDDDN